MDERDFKTRRRKSKQSFWHILRALPAGHRCFLMPRPNDAEWISAVLALFHHCCLVFGHVDQDLGCLDASYRSQVFSPLFLRQGKGILKIVAVEGLPWCFAALHWLYIFDWTSIHAQPQDHVIAFASPAGAGRGWCALESLIWHGDGSKPWYLVNPKIAGKWMFIPLKMYL